jgi:hypothetical protein
MKVNFMIVGAMKCGTSSMAWLLSEHPDICFSRPKEPNFFKEFHDWQSGLERYHSMFKHKEARLNGEGSTSYTRLTESDYWVCEHIHRYNPEMKIIYLVRHPVKRAISHYMHFVQRGFTSKDFTESFFGDKILETSCYYNQISPYIDLFGRDKVLILKFEDFIINQKAALIKTAAFLDIDPLPISHMQDVKKNATADRKVMSIQQEAFFKRWIVPKKSTISPKILEMIKKMLIWKNMMRISRHQFQVTGADQQMILDNTSRDTEKLQQIVDFDLSSYLKPVRL